MTIYPPEASTGTIHFHLLLNCKIQRCIVVWILMFYQPPTPDKEEKCFVNFLATTWVQYKRLSSGCHCYTTHCKSRGFPRPRGKSRIDSLSCGSLPCNKYTAKTQPLFWDEFPNQWLLCGWRTREFCGCRHSLYSQLPSSWSGARLCISMELW